MNRRIFVHTYLSITIVVIFLVASCSWSNSPSQFVQTTASSPLSTLATRAYNPPNTPEVWPTPVLTATPIALELQTEEEKEITIEQLYGVNRKCRLDILNAKKEINQAPKVEFLKSKVTNNQEKYWVTEVADNPSKNLRAFVACEKDFCQQKLFLENRDSGIVREINWSGRLPWRPISRIIWIGDNLLTFSHLTSPNDTVIAAVQIKEESFLIYWLTGHPCK